MRCIPCVAWSAVLACVIVTAAPGQNHFTRIWSGTPYLAMNVYITAASCDSAAVGAGDEIALFDSGGCIGLARLMGPIVAGAPLSIIASTDDPTTPATDGFLPGRPITFKIWRAVPGTEYGDASIERVFAAGSETYASLGTVVVALNGRSSTGVAVHPLEWEYRLFQNYPNPFNPRTTIRFRLPVLPAGQGELNESRMVKLDVYDLLGREVAELFHGDLLPGEHAVVFDASGLASGPYVCRIMAGRFVAQTTMILQR